jgi:hypothetical protein
MEVQIDVDLGNTGGDRQRQPHCLIDVTPVNDALEEPARR